MAFDSTPIPKLEKEIFDTFENVLLSFKLIYDKDFREHQINIKAYVYGPGCKAPSKPEERPWGQTEILVDYTDVIKGYDSKRYSFNPDLLKEIFVGLNANLAPQKLQLYSKTQEAIAKNLLKYIPREERPCGAGLG